MHSFTITTVNRPAVPVASGWFRLCGASERRKPGNRSVALIGATIRSHK
jgi:hypothetical protein